MNVWNEPVQEIFCVVKREPPPVLRWKLCEFQHRKSISVSNLIVLRGLVSNYESFSVPMRTVYIRQTYCKWMLSFVLRSKILGETPDRLKQLMVVQILEVTIYHENEKHTCLTSFNWRCETVEMRGTCLEVRK